MKLYTAFYSFELILETLCKTYSCYVLATILDSSVSHKHFLPPGAEDFSVLFGIPPVNVDGPPSLAAFESFYVCIVIAKYYI